MELDCSSNNISSIGQSPNSYLSVADNPIDCLPILYNFLDSLNIINTNITCIPNQPLTLPPSLPLCQPIGSGSCQPFPIISGSIFLDIDGNNQWDVLEPPLPHWVVQTQPYNWYGMSDTSGNYFLYSDTSFRIVFRSPGLFK